MMNHKYSQFTAQAPFSKSAQEVELFHESTKSTQMASFRKSLYMHRLFHNHSFLLASSRNYKTYHRQKIVLPKPEKLQMSFDDVLDGRESCRDFSAQPLSLRKLSGLVNALRVRWRGSLQQFPEIAIKKRVYPSAGGLYPVEVYVLAFRVDELEPAVYHVDIDQGELARLSDLPHQNHLKQALGDGGQAALAFVLTAVLPRTTVKYEALGYRFALLEGGIVSEHLALAASALGLGSLFWGGYYDDAVHDLLGVDGVEEVMVNLVFIGEHQK